MLEGQLVTRILIETIGLTKEFPPVSGEQGQGLVAVDHVFLSIREGEVFGVVGESGSGKSTLARCIFGITSPTSGVVKLFGESLVSKSHKQQRDIRSNLGFVFQDPVASLNPRMRIRDVISEPLKLHSEDSDAIEERVLSLIDRVGLTKSHLDRRAHQLSGGQCQRVAIARALSTNPKAILLDEPTSSLDLSVQAQILNLLEDLRSEFGLTYFLISHNLDVISHLSDRIAVMSAGKIVETGPTSQIVEDPRHPFTKQLVNAYANNGRAHASNGVNFDLDAWQEAPLNRWAFQHVDEFLPTKEISASESPHVWEREIDPKIENIYIDYEGQTSSLEKFLVELDTDSCLVVRDDRIVFERYFNNMTEETPHLLQSVSKSLLGVLVGQFIDEGLINPKDEIGKYLPELKGSGFFDATVQDALDMTVAVKFSELYHDANSEIQRLDRVVGWRHRCVGDPDGIHEFIRSIRKNGAHGEQFQYCSANTDLLAWLLTEVSGISYPELLSRRIWKPIGARHKATVTVDELGDALGNGGISATTRDIALFGRALLRTGQFARNSIVSDRWLHETNSGAPASVASADYLQALHPGGSYRNQWWITKGDHEEFYGVGIYGQYLWLDPTSDTVIVKFSTLPIATSTEHSKKHMSLFKAIGHL
jgi:hypothetical protein